MIFRVKNENVAVLAVLDVFANMREKAFGRMDG